MDIEEFLNITLRPGSLSGTFCHPIVSLTKCRKSVFVWGFYVYVFSLLAPCGLFSLLTKCELFLISKDVCWSSMGLHGKEILYMHQKCYSFLFYTFAPLKQLLFQLLFFQSSCKVGLSSLFETTNGCHRIFSSREGQVPQCVLRATTATQCYCVACSFLPGLQPYTGVAVDQGSSLFSI